MKPLTLWICILLSSLVAGTAFSQNPSWREYIQQYSDIAVSEMKRSGVPASIKLAQALLESNAGRSELAMNARNHFGIKCGGNWTGCTYELKDDEFNEIGEKIHSCFRCYEDATASFVAHSEFLTDQKKSDRYGFLFELEPTDYQGWAKGLRKAGYATDPRYSETLVKIVEDYGLYRLDEEGMKGMAFSDRNKQGKTATRTAASSRINDVKVVFAKEGETVASLSEKYDIPASRILAYNELNGSAATTFRNGDKVYLQAKRSSFRGKKKWHTVREGETMYTISQDHGIQLDNLISRNNLKPGDEPLAGQKVILRGHASRKDTPRTVKGSKPGQPARRNGEWLDFEIMPNQILSPGEQASASRIVFKKQYTMGASSPEETNTLPVRNKVETPAQVPVKQAVDPATVPSGKPATAKPTVPAPSQEKIPAATQQLPGSHIVQKGETLYRISKLYGLSVDQILALNGLKDPAIHPGQNLRLK